MNLKLIQFYYDDANFQMLSSYMLNLPQDIIFGPKMPTEQVQICP